MAEKISAEEIAMTIQIIAQFIEGWVERRGGGGNEIMAIADGVLLSCWVEAYEPAADAELLSIHMRHLPKSLSQLRAEGSD